MSETLINQNQIRDGGGGSSNIKVLNVVQVGTLNKDGAVFSGFSKDNYLRLGARVEKGILSLDSTTYYKSFEAVIPSANNWEFVSKIHYIEGSSQRQGIFACNRSYGSCLTVDTTGVLMARISFADSPNSYVYVLSGSTVLTTDTDYWVKFEFTGTEYKIYLSTDGENYNLEASQTDSSKIENNGYWIFGREDSPDRLFSGSIDISESYIKANGDFWWKGAEEL